MATTYDNASLVMIPSGVKESKLYSIKPTDGSGDFTFSRGTDTATRVNSSGLIEKERSNQLLQSNTFTTTWSTTRASFVSGQSGYDGTNDAWAMVDDANNSTHLSAQSLSIGASVATFSIYAKAGDVDFLAVRFEGSAVDYAYFDLANGTLGTIDSDYIEARITDVGGGWYRCEATRVLAASGNQVVLLSASADNDPTYAGAGTTAIYIQDAQVNYGLIAQPYIETTTAAVYEGITDNLPRLDYSGGASCPSLLLEPSRTNVLQNSEYFSGSDWINNGVTITDNAAISPEGKTNASLLTGVSGGLGIVKFSTWTATNKVASCFAKSGTGNIFKIANVSAANRYVLFDLSDGTISEESANWTGSIEDFGNGWYRCTAISNNETGTFSLGTTAASDSVYIYGAQLEAGSYPTSYIPCMGTSASRAGDSCNGAGDSSTFNDSEGVLYAEISALANDSSNRIISVSDGSGSNRLLIKYDNSSNLIEASLTDGGVDQAVLTHTYTIESDAKIAFKYKANDFALWVNGVEVDTDNSGTMPSGLDTLNFDNGSGGSAFYGNAKQILYFPTALTDAELAALTTI